MDAVIKPSQKYLFVFEFFSIAKYPPPSIISKIFTATDARSFKSGYQYVDKPNLSIKEIPLNPISESETENPLNPSSKSALDSNVANNANLPESNNVIGGTLLTQ